MYHQMLINGPKMEQKQVQLARIVDIGAELFAIAASATRAQRLIAEGKPEAEVLKLFNHFCAGARVRVADNFRGMKSNHDAQGYKLAQDVLKGYEWMTEFRIPGKQAHLHVVPDLSEEDREAREAS